MTVLYVLLIIGVILFALAVLPFHIRIVYEGEPKVFLRVLFLNLCLFPRPPGKPLKLRAFKKGYPKEKEKKKRKKEKPEKPAENEERSLAALRRKIALYIRVAMRVLEKFKKHILLEELTIRIALGGEDAAKTAVTCGIVSQSVAYLLAWLDDNFACKRRMKSDVNVACDFTNPLSVYRLSLGARLCLWQILDIAIIAAYNLFIKKDKT